MRASARRRLAIAAIGSMLLSGCWLFPPFMPPLEPGTRTYVVENATDTDWVLELRSDFTTAYAIPAGETGTVDDWSTTTDAIVLMTDACDVVDEIEATADTTTVRIEEPGTLAATDEAATQELEAFGEYWGCPGGFGAEPVGEAALPGADDSILLYGEDGLPYRYDPAAGTIAPALPDGDPLFYDMGHTWSPDGTRVAYGHATETSPTTSLYIANADGSDAQLLVEDATSPLWSPDSKRIAYLDGDPFARDPGIWIIDLETDERALVADGVGAFSWSPDGSRFAYITAAGFGMEPETTPSEVHIIDADGSNDRLIGATVPFALPPAWSPDGSRLAFASVPAGEDLDAMSYESAIGVYEVASGALTTVASAEGASYVEPAWSPDGSRLAFSASEFSLFSSAAYVGIVDADGGEVSRHGSDDSMFVSTPTWSPDGVWLVVAIQGGMEFSTVLVAIDPDDPNAEPTTLVSGVLYVLAWPAE